MITDYKFKYVGTREAAEEYLEKVQKYGYLGRILKVRDDLYQIRIHQPD